VILLGINAVFLFGIYKQVFLGQQFGDKPLSNVGLILVAVSFVLFCAAFYALRLETIIKKDGIYVRFFPLTLSFNFYDWNKIESLQIRTYNSLQEYGGWGLRMGPKDKGEALNISGNQGLQITFKNNRKLLIGTQKPIELTSVLQTLQLLK
jgi:hypothetical protein